ncbi:alpha-1,3-mannosyl-glycoprotein 4-beta-N-acetylglucosaminyltransferase A-like [Anopheles darlingi]|uniref:alpha-1,3-mannosyl-glycoprotein 4-beta-N-acetylglucosaminyltransferase A-like n=1 Tax=Anopheles darlingi TaxID=43151 RepID=UPI00210002A1|nr:alpha-1,3-mannosyl-glycoprotein 4-beta-N-acetylglucosaminyltransferase A-like [Anopheles darlingi]
MIRGFLKFRMRVCLYELIVILVPCTILLIVIAAILSPEQTYRMAKAQMWIQHRDSAGSTNELSPENIVTLEGLAANPTPAVTRKVTTAARLEESLQISSVFDFLPHLLDDSASLQPSYVESKRRQGVSIVLGIPTVKRDKRSYLVETIDNLIANMDEKEQNDTMIVVYVGEPVLEDVKTIAQQLRLRFGSFIDSGFLEIIAPPASYYPKMDNIRPTLNDPLERFRWRSKQNLDFAFLMAYARPRGAFYLQLEDDIITKKGFVTVMKNFALQNTAKKQSSDWFVLDFCQLGFIGKMFKSSDLPWLITFFQMFYKEQPVDWLLYYMISTKICRTDQNAADCKQKVAKLWIHYEPSLFQHIGTHSSLLGKVQNLKDDQFGKIPNFIPHLNPPAEVHSSIPPYQSHTIEKAYAGENFFWGLTPKPDDLIEFRFKQPITLRRYVVRSGSLEKPLDRFYNTTVEVLPVDSLTGSAIVPHNVTNDGFLVVGSFDNYGKAEGVIDPKIGKLKELRLHVHSSIDNWVILRETISEL